MTFSTLEIIHNLLTEEMDRIETDLDEARQVLAEIHCEAADESDGEAPKKIREADLRQRALMRDLSGIMAALDDFNGQDWH